MRGSLSAEVRVERGLRQFQCSGINFVKLAKASGIQVAQSSFALVMSGGKDFDADTAARLLDLLEQMRLLQSDIDVPIDWSRSELVVRTLAVRRLQRIAHETGDACFDSYANALTGDVAVGVSK